jgi:hypothetical protein
MQDVHLAVNRNARLSVRQVGRDRTPLILVDDFAADPAPLIDYACTRAEYGADETSYYPGRRARLPRSYVREVLNHLYRVLFEVYGVPSGLGMKPVNAVFSLIATPEAELEPRQCAPHFDSTRPFYLAVLHYLNEGRHCDTGLFRHRETGLERITEENAGRYVQSRERHAERHGAPARAYIRGSNEQFELYERIGYRPNRLVVYPGGLLHSGLVDPAVDVDPNPRTGRLTANIFVDFFPLTSGN